MGLTGITIKVYVKTQTGVDPFGHPVYEETPEEIDNVLVYPASEAEILDVLNLTGHRIIYQLGLPKGDAHDWTNVRVDFLGRSFRTVGDVREGIEANIPMQWHRIVRVEAVNE